MQVRGIKVSKLNEATELREHDFVPLVQDGETKKFKLHKLKNNLEIYTKEEIDGMIEDAVSRLNALATGVKFNILESDFLATRTITIYKAILNHNLDLDIERFSISFYNEELENISLDYKILDKNNIEIYSDIPCNITVAIKQCIEVEVEKHRHDISDIDNFEMPEIDLSDYYTKQEIDDINKKGNFNKDWGKLDVYNDEFLNRLLHENLTDARVNSTRIVNYNDSKLVYTSEVKNQYGDLKMLDISTGITTTISAYIPSSGCILQVVDNDIYVLGGGYAPGYGYTSYTSNSFRKYSLSTKEWTTLAGYHNFISGTTSVLCNGEIYVYGGSYYNGSSGSGYPGGFRKYNIEQNKWITLPISGYQEDYRSWYLFQLDNRYVYAVASYYYTHVIKKFDIETETWETVTNFPEGVESNSIRSTICAGTKVYFFGSNLDTDGNAKVYVYDIENNSWDKDTVRYPFSEARDGYTCLVDGKILILLQKDSQKQLYEFTPKGSVLNWREEVSQTKGSSKDISRYVGINGQVVVNTTNNTLHVMDGEKAGGYELAKKSDIESCPSDFGAIKGTYKYELNKLNIRPPKNYNNEDFIIITSNSNTTCEFAIIIEDGNTPEATKIKRVCNISLTVSPINIYDFSNRNIGKEELKLSDIMSSTDSKVWSNKQKYLDFTNIRTKTLVTGNSDKYFVQQQLRSDSGNLEVEQGRIGQIIVNTETKRIHLMDGSTFGGTVIPNMNDLEEVFTHVSNGKRELETTIIDKGGEVSKENNIPTFTELKNGINSINGEDIAGKQAMLDTLISKVPALKDKLTIDSPLKLYAHYMMMIGPMNLVYRETTNNPIIVGKDRKSLIISQINYNLNPTLNEYSHNTFNSRISKIKLKEHGVPTLDIKLWNINQDLVKGE